MTKKIHKPLKLFSGIIRKYKVKSALQYCIKGENRISELLCDDDYERQHTIMLLAKLLQAPQFIGEIETLSQPNRTVIFFNDTGSQIVVR